MIRINKILFPTDFSPSSEQALRYALYLADKYGAQLHMMHVLVLHGDDPNNPSQQFPKAETIEAQLREMAEARLRGASGTVPASAPTVHEISRRAVSVPPAIVEEAGEGDFDLIVMGTHGRRGVKHLLLGSVTEEVIRLAPCPVLAVPQSAKAPGKVARILVPVDFSDPSREAVQVARYAASTYGADIQLLHVLENRIHPAFYNMGAMSLRDLQPDIIDRTERALRSLYDGLDGPSMPAETSAVEGHAGRDIVRFAEQHDSDLVIIPTHGLSGLEALLLGGVSEKVVRRAPCPVLVLKAFQRSLLHGTDRAASEA